jgi:hypothetical protein
LRSDVAAVERFEIAFERVAVFDFEVFGFVFVAVDVSLERGLGMGRE